jgi:hypothetical protein
MKRSGHDADQLIEAAEIFQKKEGEKQKKIRSDMEGEELLHSAADRHAAPEKIHRARSIAGEIDHNALTREIIARFPKILAALAE